MAAVVNRTPTMLAYDARRLARTEARFRSELAACNAELLEPGYLGTDKSHQVKCEQGHICLVRPDYLHGKRIILCHACIPGYNPAGTWAKFREILAAESATLLETEWLGRDKPHRIICKEGHPGSPTPGNVVGGSGICKTCSDLARRGPRADTVAPFRARLEVIGAELLEPEWLGRYVPHLVKCSEGHLTRPIPVNVLNGHGICRACVGHDPEMAVAEFRARLAAVGAKLLEAKWLGRHTRHRVECAEGHACMPLPGDLLRGFNVCRTCSREQLSTVFYVVSDGEHHRAKFGLTWGTGGERLGVHRRAGYRTVIRLLTGLPSGLPDVMERDVSATLRLAGLEPVKGREYFDISALAVILDVVDNYPVPAAVAAVA